MVQKSVKAALEARDWKIRDLCFGHFSISLGWFDVEIDGQTYKVLRAYVKHDTEPYMTFESLIRENVRSQFIQHFGLNKAVQKAIMEV